MQTKHKTRKRLLGYSLLLISLLGLIVLGRPLCHLWQVSKQPKESLPLLEKGYADDVSRLNKTLIHQQVKVAPDSAEAIGQLLNLLAYARKHHLPVSIAGARHSMGGHTIAPEGIQVDMLPFGKLSLDTTTGVLTVGAGALWSEVIPYLNQYRRAVGVMQSDNAFSVGGSISVNCHGWQHNQPPIASTIKRFRILTAEGELLVCSREQNPELFSLALGGYGLFGIILEADLQTVPNEIYSFHQQVIPAEQYLDYYQKYVDQNPKARMVYGRLNVNRENFFKQATLNYFEYEEEAPRAYPLTDPGFTSLKRAIFLGSKQDEYGKQLRWNAEKLFSKTLVGKKHSRNQIMNESPALYLNQSPARTDILHEYFIPKRNFNAFLRQLRQIVPTHQADLLNVTIRNVYKDEDTFLAYAQEEVFALVLFFNQSLTPAAEEDMQALTQELINVALELEGKYYLPYRLHASQEQFEQAYPMAGEFFQKKLLYDPEERFQNTFYLQYKSLALKGQESPAGSVRSPTTSR